MWLLAAAALLLLAYPVFRSLTRHESAPAPPGSTTKAAVLLDRSLQQYQAGKYRDAIAASREALKLNPNSEVAYNNIAASYGAMRMWDEAIQNIREALRIKPDFTLAQNNLAWFLSARQGGTAAPPLPPAADHLSRSLTHYNGGRYQQCIDEAREALKLKPDYAEAYNNIAAGYMQLGNWDEAIKNAQEALRLKPDFALARNNLNLVLERKAAAGAATRK